MTATGSRCSQGALLSGEAKFLVVSANCDRYVVDRLERLKFHGFVDKTSNSIGELKRAVELLRTGRIYLSAAFQAAKLAKLKDQKCFTKVLSDREQAVFSLVGCGCTDDEIGARLSMSPKTAKTHRNNLLRRFNLPSTPKLMALAVSQGLTRFVAALASDRTADPATSKALPQIASGLRHEGETVRDGRIPSAHFQTPTKLP
ncbi:MAG: response regulator transcription factor [Opitutaceae bacterium]